MDQPAAGRVNCESCGKGLRWRAEFVGRRMKCTCGSMFIMPAAPGVAEPTAAAPAPPIASLQPALPPVAGPEDPFKKDAFELDFPGAADALSPPIGGTCPSCRAPMKSGAVLCVRCGFHTVTGRTLSTGTQDDARDPEEPRPRAARALLNEETDHRFTEVYLPVAMIIVGVIVTIIRAYTGMGELDAYDDAETSAYNSPFFEMPAPEGENYFEEGTWDEEGDEPLGDVSQELKKPADESGVDGEAPVVPDATEPTVDAQAPPQEEAQPPVQPRRPQPPARAPPATSTSSKGFNVSPIIVATASIAFQLLVMVPFVFVCVLFVAKYVDVTFGSLPTVLLKLTAIVLGPMAIADWIDDILLQATMGFGFVLGWTIRLVLVGSSLIKLFDLDFFEAMVLMIVVAFVRFMLTMLLVYALVAMFVN